MGRHKKNLAAGARTVLKDPFRKPTLSKFAPVLLFLLVILSAGEGWCRHVYVLKVLDGDSIRVKSGGKIFDVRLYGIDAPEYGQRFGDRARYFTRAHVLKRTVTIEQRDVDRYGRVVAVVKSSGKMVNRELVKNGLAWVYPRYCLDKKLCATLKKDEKGARAARRGLWKDEAPVSPWQWKATVRKEGSVRRYHREYRFPNWR